MNMENDGKDANKINCFQCAYFAITWEPAFPKSCKLFGFKSAALPSLTVLETTGSACLGFLAKDDKKHNAQKHKKPRA